jgi:hypothetical protein
MSMRVLNKSKKVFLVTFHLLYICTCRKNRRFVEKTLATMRSAMKISKLEINQSGFFGRLRDCLYIQTKTGYTVMDIIIVQYVVTF